jgi:hypothetical protein
MAVAEKQKVSPERKFILRNVIVSYPKIAEGEEDDTGQLKFSAAFITTEQTNVMDLAAAEAAAARDKWGPKGPQMIEDEELATTWRRRKADVKKSGATNGYVNARGQERPGCVLRDKTPVTSPQEIKQEFYAGAVVNVSLFAYGYDRKGKKGVSFGLNNIQKVRDGKRLDNRKSAEEEFDALLDDAGEEQLPL